MNHSTTIPYWRLSSFYFFYFATVGSFVPYWSLYLKQVGFNADAIGELSALLISTKMISPNVWGWIADRTGKSLRIIRFASFFAGFLFLGFLFFQGYGWYAAITLSFSFFWNAALPQFEAVTLRHVKTEPHRYSRIRLWGSVGFIAAVLGIGRLLDDLGVQFLPIVVVSVLGLMWLASLITPDAPRDNHHSHAEGMVQILKKPEVLAFLSVSFLVQLAHSPYYVFYSMYLRHYHYSGSEIGLLWTGGVVAEIILFIFMKRLLKLCTLRLLLLSSVFLSILRWFLVSRFADNLIILATTQVLHAATFGGTHIAAMHFVYRYFGEKHQGKGQALYTSLSFGLGGMLGSLYAGYFWETQSPEFVYLIAALYCSVALLIAYIWVGRERTVI